MRAAEASVVLADPHASLGTAVDLGDANAPKTDIHNRPKQVRRPTLVEVPRPLPTACSPAQALGARLAAGALLDLWGLGDLTASRGPAFASASRGGGAAGVMSATVTFAPPFDGPGSLTLANVTSWPGVLPASECPGAAPAFDCAGFALQVRCGG